MMYTTSSSYYLRRDNIALYHFNLVVLDMDLSSESFLRDAVMDIEWLKALRLYLRHYIGIVCPSVIFNLRTVIYICNFEITDVDLSTKKRSMRRTPRLPT